MYIAPTTNIRLLSGVPLDSHYENTLYFSRLSDQVSYFAGKTKYNLIEQTFNRVTNGVSRVALPVNSLYDCNYMMFQNTGFGNKWFFAFIDSVEYVNNTVSEVHFTIDVMQTWLFDYTLEQCFVERCHSATDAIGDNIVPEPVDPGEMVYNSYGRLATGENELVNYVIILAINDVSGSNAFAGKYDLIPSGSALWAFNSGDLPGVEAKINEYIQRPDAVTALYVAPQRILGWSPVDGGENILNHYGVDTHSKPVVSFTQTLPEAHRVSNASTLGGYTPKNKKLLTYPFNYLEVLTGTGSALTLRYEFFNGTPAFDIGGTISQPVSVSLRPDNYKGTPSGQHMSDEQLSLSGYPMGSWLNDAYEAWVAQQSVPLALSAVGSIGSGFVSGLATGNLPAAFVGAGMAGIGAVTNVLSEKYQASIAADQFHGTNSGGNVNFALSFLDFYAGRRSVNAQFARIIDDYFSMFGYAQKCIMVPPKHNRAQWTYVKTIGCQGSGSVPNDDAVAIDTIYNNGVRFWAVPANLGNYSLTNGTL